MSRDRYAVFGHPITHSRSPFIHARFAAQVGADIEYTAIDVTPEQWMETLWEFGADGGQGANVTLPLKEYAAGHCDELSAAAARAGAVNTLIRLPGQRWRGDNTDGAGLMADFTRLGIELQGRRVLILGAGGATRGILAPLLATSPGALIIANRSLERAQHLQAEFASLGAIQARSLDALDALEPVDVLIHATSAYRGGALAALPDGLMDGAAVAYDLSYGAAAEPFLRAASAVGARALHDGLGMLVEQAAESFLRWRGVRPLTAPVLAELRAQL